MDIEAAYDNLRFIQMGIKLQNKSHLRHFVDCAYCELLGYVRSSGRVDWRQLIGCDYVSPGYVKLLESGVKLTPKNHIRIEHVVPMKVISKKLLELKDPSVEDIGKFLLDNVVFAAISKEEDMMLNSNGLNSKMPDEYYDPSHELYDNPLARYIKAGIEIYKNKG